MALAWNDNSNNELGFKIERAGGTGSSGYVQIGQVGANITTFTDTTAVGDVPYSYRVRAYNAAGDSGYSNVLTHTAFNGAPTITAIADQTVAFGASGTPLAFQVGDDATAPELLGLSAQSSNPAVVALSGIVLGGSGVQRTITVSPVNGASGSAVITVRVSDGTLMASRSFTFTVLGASVPPPTDPQDPPPPPPPPPAGVAPSITTQPIARTVAPGAAVSFVVDATGQPAPTYQWQKDGRPVIGGNASTLTLTGVTEAMAGSYTVRVANTHGSVTSQAAALVVSAAPIFTLNPHDTIVGIGESVTLSSAAAGTPEPVYQWRRNGVPLAGATGPTLTLLDVQPSTAGIYDVLATNPGGSATSVQARLVVRHAGYAGTYFGEFANGGRWALHVQDDNSGHFLAYLPPSGSALVVPVSIRNDGTFAAQSNELTAAGVVRAMDAGQSAAAAPGVARTVEGRIGEGSVTGVVTDLGGLTFAGPRQVEPGEFQSIAGFYIATSLEGTAGNTYAVIGPSGRALIVVATVDIVDAAAGMSAPNAQIAATTAKGGRVLIRAIADSLGVTASYTAAGSSQPRNFAGVGSRILNNARLANISVRALAGLGERSLITGFVIRDGPRHALVRAIGPTLTEFGLSGVLSDPILEVRSANETVAANDNWNAFGALPRLAIATGRVGAFPLPDHTADAALVVDLPPQPYTANVSAPAGSGIALVEIYDATVGGTGRMINLSARSYVGTGDDALIVGFIIAGNSYRQFLLRAIGPTLATSFGVSGALEDPTLRLFQGSSLVHENDDWDGTPNTRATFELAGAFPLEAGSRDAVLVVTLRPGIYSAVVTGTATANGVALLELYEIP